MRGFFVCGGAGAPRREEWAAGPFFVCEVGEDAMLRDTLLALLQPVVEGLGYELWELEYQPGRGNALLRIYLDTAAAGASRSMTASGRVAR